MDGKDAVGWFYSRMEMADKLAKALKDPQEVAPDREQWLKLIVKHPLSNALKEIAKRLLHDNTVAYDSNLRLQGPTYQVFPLLEELEKANSQLHSVYKLIGSLNDCDYAMIPMSLQYLYVKGFKTRSCILEQWKGFEGHLVFREEITVWSLPVQTVFLYVWVEKLAALTINLHHASFINDPFDWAGLKKPMKKPLQPTVGLLGIRMAVL